MYNFDGVLIGKVALVTGASRGIGKGIAEMLVRCGATVYITGRRNTESVQGVDSVSNELNGINKGVCKALFCDHSIDKEVEQVFATIEEEMGRLDILVNNAFSGVSAIGRGFGKKFYEMDPTYWDEICNVGLRSNYICGVLAAKIMVRQMHGLIINISSVGGIVPLFAVAYGVGKEGTDRLSYEMGIELRDKNVCVVSLWPGLVKTENIMKLANEKSIDSINRIYGISETPLYCGKAVVAIAADKNRMRYTSKIVFTTDCGDYYRFNDEDGSWPVSSRSVRFAVYASGFKALSSCIPRWIKVPGWVLAAYFNKF